MSLSDAANHGLLVVLNALMISLSYIRQLIFGLSEIFANGDMPYLDIRSGLIEYSVSA